MSLIPQIRFTGFTDNWEQRKLGTEVINIGTGRSRFSSGIEKSKKMPFPVLGSTSVISYDSEYDHSGDFILTARVGANAGNLYRYEGNVKISDNTVYIKANNLNFMFYLLNKFDVKKLSFGTGQPLVKASELKNLSLYFPNNDEQKKIGSLFNQLDKIIALHQRQLELLKEQKKGFLQKMVPKNGSSKPEIRFSGFTDDWEQRKLSDGTSKIGDGLHGTPKYTDDGDVFFINGNNLVNGKIVINKETKFVTESEQSKDDKILNEDTILMSINGTIGNLAWYQNEKVMLGKSAAYLTISTFDKKFVYAYLQTTTVKNHFMNSLTGTTIKNLGLKTIRDTTLLIPVLEEQKKIGSFFKQLDDTIALHQRKLELLKEQKKVFLQKMFV